MKKKFISAMLFGALTLASTTTFVSCKDYDDDISNLQTQINKLATADELTSKISEMQSAISTAKSEAIAQAESAAQVAAAAQTAASKAQSAADAAQAAADAAQAKADQLEANGATKTEVEAAQAAADAAKAAADAAAADAAKAAADAKADLEAAQEKLQAAADAASATATEALTAANQAITDLAAYKTANDAAVAANDAAIKAAQADATSALAKVAELEKNGATKAELAAAQQAASDALTKAVEALNAKDSETVTAVNKAQAAAESAANVAAAADSLSKANKALIAGLDNRTGIVESAIAKIQGENWTESMNLSSLDNRLSKLESLIVVDSETGAGKVDLSAMSDSIDAIQTKLKAIIGEYSTMVTSVSLYKSTGYDDNNGGYGQGHGYYYNVLDFVSVTEAGDVSFPAETGATDKQFTFKKGDTKTYEASLIIRVSPTTAVLDPAKIHLIDGQGSTLDEFVTCSKVTPYSTTYYDRYTEVTRASESSTNGLWKATFKLKDGYVADDLYSRIATKVKGVEKYVLFAVGINNTTLNGNDNRLVVSEYDVEVAPKPADHVSGFVVSNLESKYVSVNGIHNRYYGGEDSNWRAFDNWNKIEEQVWKSDAQISSNIIVKGDDKNTNSKVEDDITDDRQGCLLLPVAVDEDINIVIGGTLTNTEYVNGTNQYGSSSSYKQGDLVSPEHKIKGFYVTLDTRYALESGKSEINAWNSYTYENVGTSSTSATLIEGNSGAIKIKNLGNVKGDIIGFRVYAVNLDGTLVDPDGQAFYVAVGSAIQQSTEISGNVTAAEGTDKSVSDYIALSGIPLNAKADLTNGTSASSNPVVYNGSTKVTSEFTVKYYDKDKKPVTGDIQDAKYVTFTMPNAADFVDGATYSQTITLYDAKAEGGAMVKLKDIVFKMTKIMPTTAKKLTVRENQGRSDADIYAMMKPHADETTLIKQYAVPAVTDATIDFTQVFSNLESTDDHYEFSLANADYADGNVIAKTFTNNYSVTIGSEFVDNANHNLSYTYNYKGISTTLKEDGSTKQYGKDYPIQGETFTTKLTDWHYNSSFSSAAWTKTYTNNGKNAIQWKSDGSGKATMDLANVDKIANSYNAELFTMTLADMETNKLVEYQNDAKLIGGDTYFTVSQSDGTLTFKQKNDSQAPQDDINCKVQFTVKDAFGHKTTISLPVIVKKPKAQ